MYNELLWIFTQLPDHYVVLDTETTGLPNENNLPDIVRAYSTAKLPLIPREVCHLFHGKVATLAGGSVSPVERCADAG